MENPNFPEKQTWGTWEELLLACAVHRYGTESWDSVAMELQKRSSTIHLTAQRCKQKYQDLKRRFTQNDTVSYSDVGNNTHSPIPWLDELRKLRVAELKREVERYDLSIVSLQLKVDRLKEEREESSRDNENKPEILDLEKTVPKDAEEENKDKDGEEEKLSLENNAGEPVHGPESDRENQSVNESNWTDPKAENLETGPEVAEKVPEPAEPASGEQGQTGSAAKPAWEDSFNGSSDTIRKESPSPSRTNSERVDSERGAGDSPQSRESAADSKGDEGTKESNSDVQSSASLSRKKGEEPDEPDNEDQSPAIKRVSEESQPLLCFLEIIRFHKLGSVFEHRLGSQETPYYMDLIRQHADLEMVRTRLEEGWYSGCYPKFFRDLLLLFNNAVVFFGKHSSESMAALEFRKLVVKEMALRIPKPEPSLKEGTLAPPASLILKPDPEPSDSLAAKPKLSVPLIACRKRSSITGKAAASSSGANNKKERTIALNDEKLTLDWKKHDKSVDKVEEENRVTKKRTRESGARNSNKNGKSRPTTNINRNSDSKFSTGMSSRAGSYSENLESKAEKEKSNMNAGAKKRSVANFLNRMKSSSSPNNRPLVENLKSSGMGSDNNKGGAEQKKNVGSKGGSRKEEDLPKGSGRKQGKEQGSPAKRSVGRPPKRGAAQPSLRPAVPAKRSRESAETEAGGSRPAKKRLRK